MFRTVQHGLEATQIICQKRPTDRRLSMTRGGLNIGRLQGKQILKPRVGKNAASRKRMGRSVSKARRRVIRQAALIERWWEQEEQE